MCDAVRESVVQMDAVEAFRGEELVPDVRIFCRVFWSFGPCIKTFRHCKPLVQVDGTHLYGKYRRTLLVAVAQDGNHNILSVAFAIVKGETADARHFFLENLHRSVVTQDGVGIISNHHESINAAIRRSNGQWEPLRAFHMYCIRHIGANFLRRFKASYLHKLVVNMGYSRTKHQFNINYERVRERGDRYATWLDEIPREKWVLAYDGGHRWGHMTTNLVECVNSVLKGARNLPITSLVRATYFRLTELFTRKSEEACARKNAGQVFSDTVMPQLQVNQQASRTLRITQADRHHQIFQVLDPSSGQAYGVDLRHRSCDCGDFQIDRYPCCHVMTCCSYLKVTWHPYVDNVYTMERICKVYRKQVGVIGNESTWRRYRGPRICPNPSLKLTGKGHPKSTRFLNEMDSHEIRGTRRCGLCRGEGHSRSRCPHAPGPSS